ncbi:response regulator [Flavobacterium noncentrifugens]|uniref:CheY chemotaxis protein or a CheY-like REC (Receiver) domain n=1 Tax=Flavobacterium noncentrifugens TaxID=1128970 RepID=A0A1G8YYR4_9FLAO|nr:response regulator [Flavobacterium noncentrifugens]GEP51384.1 response regulator [Flavobacterium noncentrifugens]SDK07120.1 CheY chemotaxis protein or a CheY-like REC (receiver) domain [Flavobacterium noncentrifugens]
MKYRDILLIDDEDDCEIFLFAIQKVYGERNYTTRNHAAKALQQLEMQQLQPDLIFLDLNMPVMNGVQFLSEIKKNARLKEIPVIILTTSSQPELMEQTKALGAHDFVTKPSDFSDFVKIFESIL